MIFGWLKRSRRNKLRSRPFPDEWLAWLHENVVVYANLTPAQQAKLRGDIQVFIAEKHWEGCNGLTMTDEIKVTIAAQACLLVLGLEAEYFERVQSILVYPNAYVAPEKIPIEGGLVLEGHSSRQGEAWYRGPVILSWPEVLAGGRRTSGGHNLVLHEFAHQLDMLNAREIDGTPPLDSPQQYRRWQRVLKSEYAKLRRDCREGNYTLLDCYGTTDLGEMFAVSTECFFQQPLEMSRQHPELYGILHDYFRVDPAAWQSDE